MIYLKLHVKAKNTFGGSPDPQKWQGVHHVGQTWIVLKGLNITFPSIFIAHMNLLECSIQIHCGHYSNIKGCIPYPNIYITVMATPRVKYDVMMSYSVIECWDLNPQPQDHEASMLTIVLSLQVKLKVVKVCVQQCPVICKVASCTEFRQFGKRSSGHQLR